eukprot:gb/GFBE01015309.1/.p1 GENE.gb/GFBE01015309.1/~~gb/GFBE01015309.1/.p1  ORF type:complete len:371 (+),score=103.48 gb/GFBE01015309.1/:1-1113(+)
MAGPAAGRASTISNTSETQSSPKQPSQMAAIAQTVTIGGAYILTSSALISFNKYLMQPQRFSHALHLTAIHMVVTFLMSLCLYGCAPQLYPTMGLARGNMGKLFKSMLPLGALFAVALFCSNQAYRYSSVAFLQFCKQGNVALIFIMSCMVGLQVFSWTKAGVLSIVIMGCTMCAHGEIHFVMIGLLLQLCSQFFECSKNLLGELIMSRDMKLDVLTFVFFQAPCSLLFLLAGAIATYTPDVREDFVTSWHLVLANAGLAFFLNVLIALTLKKLSALAFVIIGVVKDACIVASSSALFGDPISMTQRLGFFVTVCGIVLWSHLKMQEQAQKKEQEEREKQKLLYQNSQVIDYGASSETTTDAERNEKENV